MNQAPCCDLDIVLSSHVGSLVLGSGGGKRAEVTRGATLGRDGGDNGGGLERL